MAKGKLTRNCSLTYQIPEGAAGDFRLRVQSWNSVFLARSSSDKIECMGQYDDVEPDELRDGLTFIFLKSSVYLVAEREFTKPITVLVPPHFNAFFAQLSGGCRLDSVVPDFQRMNLELLGDATVGVAATNVQDCVVKAGGRSVIANIGDVHSRFDKATVHAKYGAYVDLRGSFNNLSVKMEDFKDLSKWAQVLVHGPVRDRLYVTGRSDGAFFWYSPSARLPPVCKNTLKPGKVPAVL